MVPFFLSAPREYHQLRFVSSLQGAVRSGFGNAGSIGYYRREVGVLSTQSAAEI
jgi:hypothetical protein